MRYPKLRELKEAIKNIIKGPVTTKYPYAEAVIHPRFKGKPEFQQDDCLACTACSLVCPPGAIEVIDDIENRKRTVTRYLDRCIHCGECERLCTCKNGVKMVPEFALAVYDRKDLVDSVERNLIVCEECGRPIATKKHISWLIDQLGEKGASHLGFIVMKLEELGIVEETRGKVSLDKRQDLFTILCPRCRHRIMLYDSL